MSNNDNFDNLDNKDNKRSKRTKKVDGDSGHKKPWREEYATPGEIKAFLSDHVYLRYNTVKYRVEARLPRMPSAATANWHSSSATTGSR